MARYKVHIDLSVYVEADAADHAIEKAREQWNDLLGLSADVDVSARLPTKYDEEYGVSVDVGRDVPIIE